MNDHIVVEFVDSVNTTINGPIHLTHRIKYTSWDVSENYIIFGANSGGLYVFIRHPCCFLKLIPSTEGAVVYTCISPDEKVVSVATAKGTICLVNNSETIPKDVEVYNTHLGSLITAMAWNSNSNELYTGDDTGRISVVVVTNFITKTMFQTPCATLMQLDSRIVQLDWCSNFLLVSTVTRSYLCDTAREYYRQIGKKLRDGEYGACFLGSSDGVDSADRKPEISTFRILSDKESFVPCDGADDLKIICARPGLRLWEVQLNGTVVRTNQFKEALHVEPDYVIPFTEDPDSRLWFQKPLESSKTNSVNFTKLYVLNNQFIVTFQKNALYIIDPLNVAIIFWTNIYTDIISVKIVKNIIYVWTAKNKVHVLLFTSLESFILKNLFDKRYLLCADLCITYQNQLTNLVLSSKRLHLLATLKEKLLEKGEVNLSDSCEPVFEGIRINSKERQIAQRLPSGIFVIDNAFTVDNPVEQAIQIVTNDEEDDLSDVTDDVIEKSINKNKMKGMCLDQNRDVGNKKYNLMFEDYELQKVNKLYRTHMAEEILDSCSSVEEIIDTFKEFKNESAILQPNESAIEQWCFEKCLDYLETKAASNSFHCSADCDTYLMEAYKSVNCSPKHACPCGFPLPSACENKPSFPKICRYLADVFFKKDVEAVICLCRKVPYVWKEYLKLNYNEDLGKLLPLILQFGDTELFNIFVNKFTYDIWNETLEKYVLLRKGMCLNCEKTFSIELVKLSWKDIAMQMIRSVGAESAVYLLLQKANEIPSSELDVNFYQCTIFATIVDKFDASLRENAIDFIGTITDSQELNNFGKLLEKSVLHPKQVTSPDSSKLSAEIGSKCTFCKMPLMVPVLSKEKPRKLECGHVFHNFCLIMQNDRCKICL